MTELGQAHFTIRGRAGQTFVRTQSFPGTIIDGGITLVHHKSSGTAGHTIRWQPFGSILEVRCTFTGYGGSAATVTAGFNVYYDPARPAAELPPAASLRHEVLTVELEGSPGETVEHTLEDFAGDVEAVELLGPSGDAVEEVEVERLGPRRVAVRARLAGGEEGRRQETIHIAASLRAA